MLATFDDIKKIVSDMRGTREPIQRRWDFYRNDVARVPYFPYLNKETHEHYRDRMKVGVGWCGSMVNKAASYFRKAPIEIKCLVEGEEKSDLAKEAADTWAEIAEYNDYDTFMIDVARDAGTGGNGYTKERFRFFDPATGNELKTGAYRGQVKIFRINEAFMYRIQIGNVTAFVEAWMRVKGQTKFIHEEVGYGDQEKFTYVELVQPPLFDTGTGKNLQGSRHTIWQNKIPIFGPEEIKLTNLPIQRFANLVSRPESENGISDIEWAIPLNNMINHIFSGASRAIEYHGEPKVVFRGVEDEGDIKWGTDNAIFLPGVLEGGGVPQAEFLTWNQNIEGTRSLYLDAANIMSAIGGIPKFLMHDLDGAGKVPSGVALRIMYEPLNQLCQLKEAGFKRAEEKMIKACLEQLAYYNNKPNHFDPVQVVINYNPDRTPRDTDAEFQTDVKRLFMGFYNLVDMVLKYERGVETREQAIAFLKERAKEKKELKEKGIIGSSFEWTEDDQTGKADSEISEGDTDS